MSPVDRPMEGDVLSFHLDEEIRALKAQMGTGRDRLGHTLVKEGPLRVTLVTLGPQGSINPHTADGAVAIQVLEGSISLDIAGTTKKLETGDLVTLAPGIQHAVASATGSTFLLTLTAVLPGRG